MHSVVGGNGTVKKLTTSLRAFLRYLAVKGRCRAGLADVVPGYAHWRLADLPRYLAAQQVNRLIAACDGEVGAPPCRAAVEAIVSATSPYLAPAPAPPTSPAAAPAGSGIR
jgi:hypothetical protein